MPLWEKVKVLLSLLVTDGVSDPEEQLDIGIFDIPRAHFKLKGDGAMYIELLDEATAPGEGDVIWRLNRGMYGFSDASDNRMRGKFCVVLQQAAKLEGAVHGDDLCVLADTNATCLHPSARFVKAMYSDSGNIAQRQQWLCM